MNYLKNAKFLVAAMLTLLLSFSPFNDGVPLLTTHVAHADHIDGANILDCGLIDEPGVYTIANNISTSTGYCLTIATSSVTINGGGRSITGIGSFTAIYAENVTDIDLSNMTIADFDSGIRFIDVASSSVDSVVITTDDAWMNTAIIFSNTTNSTITNMSFIADNWGIGNGVIFEQGSNGNTIATSTFSSNGPAFQNAISIEDSENSTITGNNISGITYSAVFLYDNSHGTVISHNEISDVAQAFNVSYSDNVVVEHNNVTISDFGYSGDSSPLVYTWDGNGYQYVADVGQMATRATDWLDYTVIDSDKLAPKDGKYKLNISQEYNEIVYYDELSLLTFDHAPGYTVVDPLLRDTTFEDLHTVSDTPTHPLVACTDAYGNDCLEALQDWDDEWSYQDESLVNYWTLDFGDLSEAENITLLSRVARDYGVESDDRIRSISVRNGEGEWVEVYGYRDLGSDGTPRLRSVDLTDKFLTDNYEVRVGMNLVNANYFAVDTTSQAPFTINTYRPTVANLSFRGYTAIDKTYFWNHDYDTVFATPEEHFAPQTGLFTKYGEVAPLLQTADNQFMIMHHGDHVAIEFPYEAPENGLERSFILKNNVVYKHAEIGAEGRTVNPLPYQGMAAYPSEGYPFLANEAYLAEWNTREIKGENFAASFPYSINTTVRYNSFTGNGDYTGILMFEEASSTIAHNTISNFQNGINVYDAEDILIEYNIISNMASSGILSSNVDNLTIRHNTISEIDSEWGISVYNSSPAVISENEITSADGGIGFDSPVVLTMNANEINATGTGIQLLPHVTLNGAKTISDNVIIAGDWALSLDDTPDITVLGNTLQSEKWIANGSPSNVFDDGTAGNIYLFANGSGAWTVYDIKDNDDDSWADVGEDLPFSEEVLTDARWDGIGQDAHPYTEIAFVEDEDEDDTEITPTPPRRSSGSSSRRGEPFILSPVTTTTDSNANPDLNTLIEQLRSLVAKYVELGGTPTPAMQSFIQTSTDNTNTGFEVRDLYLNDEGEDVRALQLLLISAGYIIPPGATGYFANYTKSALSQYQQDKAISPAIGYFGSITRAKMKAEGTTGLWW